jgi:hypothetical protein
MERRLFFPGYYSGFSNNRMSLDIAVALAHLTGRTLVPYRFRMPRRVPVVAEPDHVVDPILVPELFEIPVPWSGECLLKTWVSPPDAVHGEWPPVYESVLCFPTVPHDDDRRFAQFRNGRASVYALSEHAQQANDLVVSTRSLGDYCYFFYLDDSRRRHVITLMQQLRPKRPYLDAANRIAGSLGRFNAIHLRRGDFVHNQLSQERVTRAASINGQEIVENLATRMSRDELLVVCTDGSSQEELFGPLQKHFRDVVFLDRFLREDKGARDAIADLPRIDESVDALLTQVVASQALVFAGTLFSTFTNLIHRQRTYTDPDAKFLYCYNDFQSPLVRFDACEFLPVDDGAFTWNRIRYPVSPDAYAWLREWPEAIDNPPPLPETDALPPGTLELVARDATLSGGLRLEHDDGFTAIGNWIDPQDLVTWTLVLPESGSFSVEIRYACPMEAAGSDYRVGVCRTDELQASVWNTGHLASLSPWLALGQLRLAAGRNTLYVRAIGPHKRFIMNLNGLRLTPLDRLSR